MSVFSGKGHTAFTPEEYEKLTPERKKYIEQREDLLRAALEELLIHGRDVRNAMLYGGGIWYSSLAALYPQERTLVLREVKKLLDLPAEA